VLVFSKKLTCYSVSLFLSLSISSTVIAEEIIVAVASNFLSPFNEISKTFQKSSGHKILIVSGSTGSLFAQIVNGAPYHIFLSADNNRPKKLEENGLTIKGTLFVYAMGRLTLWSADPDRIKKNGLESLRENNIERLAIANPKTAPYGQAATEVLKKLNLWDRLFPIILRGGNITQAFQYVATGNAEMGFVALSQTLDPKLKIKGSRWDIPQEMHRVLEQSAVLLKNGEENKGASELMRFMKQNSTQKIIRKYGYDIK
jgi:molybdate transport system substrate-binding protein